MPDPVTVVELVVAVIVPALDVVVAPQITTAFPFQLPFAAAVNVAAVRPESQNSVITAESTARTRLVFIVD